MSSSTARGARAGLEGLRVRSRNGLGRDRIGNQMLIALQALDVKFVAGFHA